MTNCWLFRVASHPKHGGGHLARMQVLAAAMLRAGACLLLDPPSLKAAVADADFAIGHGGVSMLERIAAGVPSLTLLEGDNQNVMVEGAVERGAAFGIKNGAAIVTAISRSLEKALANGVARASVSATGRNLIDDGGADRVARRLLDLACSSVASSDMTVDA